MYPFMHALKSSSLSLFWEWPHVFFFIFISSFYMHKFFKYISYIMHVSIIYSHAFIKVSYMHKLFRALCINFSNIEFKQIPWSLICINDLVNWFKYNVKCISGIVHEFISSNSFFFFPKPYVKIYQLPRCNACVYSLSM